MNRLNHLGSAALLAALAGLLTLMLLPVLGVALEWKPQTMPHRLLSQPFVGWGLVVVLAVGLLLIRQGSRLQQCTTALVLVGVVFGLGLASGFFWDPWLCPLLIWSAQPMLRAATRDLQAQLR